MALASWYREDPLPELPRLDGLQIGVARDSGELARLAGLPVEAVETRWEGGHTAYVARLFGRPVAYGWVAGLSARIGELDLAFRLAPDERYLWDFETVRHCRGRGIYPRLLQAIIEAEVDAKKFWIIHAPENLPSGVGIERAGFTVTAELSLRANGEPGLVPLGPVDRVLDAADLLGVPLVRSGVSPCWSCGRRSHACGCGPDAEDEAGCACWLLPAAV
ncbi:MAG TPA: hypothetical protein VNN10_14635 [Dehalococcoidia bacterium]|nr:hypothetical protein [Dehalococcoidia bacterium]